MQITKWSANIDRLTREEYEQMNWDIWKETCEIVTGVKTKDLSNIVTNEIKELNLKVLAINKKITIEHKAEIYGEQKDESNLNIIKKKISHFYNADEVIITQQFKKWLDKTNFPLVEHPEVQYMLGNETIFFIYYHNRPTPAGN